MSMEIDFAFELFEERTRDTDYNQCYLSSFDLHIEHTSDKTPSNC